MIAIVSDITRLKQTQEALRETEYRYRQLFAAITDSMFVHRVLTDGRPGRFIEVNDVACLRLGYSCEELLSMTPEDIEAPDLPVSTLGLGEQLASGKIVTFEQTHIRRDGRRLPVEISARMFDFQGQPAVMSLARDITELKRTMELLRISEQRLRFHIMETPLGVIEWDTDFRVTNWNPGAEKIFGYSKAEAMGRRADMLASDSVSTQMDDVFSLILKRQISMQNTGEYFSKSGPAIICDWYNSPLKDTDGKVFGIASLVNDITERKQAEQALLESERRYRSLVDYSPDGIGVLVEGKFRYINNAGILMLGAKSGDEIIGKSIMEITHPDYRKLALQRIWAFPFKAEPDHLFEQKLLRLDGRPIDVEIIEIPTVYSGIAASEIVIHDITERKQREKVITTYQKQLQDLMYESTLLEERERKRIADILHDTVGQNLVFSKLKLSFLRESSRNAMQNQKDLLEEIINLINETIGLSRSLTSELCNPVLYLAGFEAAVKWLAEQIEKNYGIPCELTMGAGLSYIKGETGSLLYRTLRELVYNVVKHAKAKSILISIRNLSGNIDMEIVDDGIGFDTTGLKNYGLFSVAERVKYLGGSIHVKSEIGKGTHVSLTVPIKQKKKGGPLQ
jgi:PAS domain S-box-containing protein